MKATGVWLVLVLLAILNGIVRENVLLPQLGNAIALPLSGVSLSLLVLITAYVFIPVFGRPGRSGYIGIGLFWLLLTLSFEFLFGHYIIGTSWQDLAQVFNIMQGNLFTLVLIVTVASPWLAASTRGLV
ncbi:MAG: hypothetical protein ACK2UP_17705 [Candidatus Promineifilaceae bacterium]